MVLQFHGNPLLFQSRMAKSSERDGFHYRVNLYSAHLTIPKNTKLSRIPNCYTGMIPEKEDSILSTVFFSRISIASASPIYSRQHAAIDMNSQQTTL
jgi:hypothetical protein